MPGLCLLLSLFSSALQASGSCKIYPHLNFGILPFISNEQLVHQFSPLMEYLGRQLEVPVRLVTAPDFSGFARRTAQGGHYDILFTAPHLFPQAMDRAGYRLVASVDSPGLWAVIVVPKTSDINDIHDLKGRRLATVQSASLATLLVKKYLKEAGIDPEHDLVLVATPSHDASLLSSYHGVTDASSLMQTQYDAASEQVRNNMRIIARTEKTPHIPISVSPRIVEDCASEIADVLLNINRTEAGRRALRNNRFTGFRKAKISEYDAMRELFNSNAQ